jgi:hypothetical protein
MEKEQNRQNRDVSKTLGISSSSIFHSRTGHPNRAVASKGFLRQVLRTPSNVPLDILVHDSGSRRVSSIRIPRPRRCSAIIEQLASRDGRVVDGVDFIRVTYRILSGRERPTRQSVNSLVKWSKRANGVSQSRHRGYSDR